MGSIGYWRVTYVAFTHPVILTRNIIVGELLRAALLWESASAKIANGLTLYISPEASYGVKIPELKLLVM